MSDLPTVDCLIVSFNTKELTRQTIITLQAHSTEVPAHVQLSVFDNASTDGSPEMLEREFPDVRLHRGGANLGFGAANNALASSSNADYLLLLNSDVVVTQDLITPLLDELSADSQVLAVGPRLLSPDGSPQFSAPHFPTLAYEFALVIRGKRVASLLKPLFDVEAKIAENHELAATIDGTDRSSEFVWATCWLIRRSDVAEGIFDGSFPMYDEDLDFCRAGADRGRRFRYVGRVSLTHIGGASSPSGAARYHLVRTSRRRYYRRYHGRRAAWVYAWLVPLAGMLSGAIERIPLPRRAPRVISR